MTKDMMAKRVMALLTGLSAGLFPALSFGLGLGDLQIDSRLNQQLRARIEIADVSDEEWRMIRARVAPRELLTDAGLHPELLSSISMKAIEDADHRHWVEVRSQDPLIEPLFDLPVDITGPSGHVVRNFTVMLDPALATDAPPTPTQQVVAVGAAAPAVGQSKTNVEEKKPTETVARVARHHGGGRHRARTHRVASNAGTLDAPQAVVPTPAATGAAAPANGTSAPKAVPTVPAAGQQQQLAEQLNTLQQTLVKMQETIKAQDAEVEKLTAQIAARSEQASRPQTVVIRPPAAAVSSKASPSDQSANDGAFSVKRSTVYWGVGVALAAVLGGIALTSFIRRRRDEREALERELARKEAAASAPRSNPTAWQNSLRAAQSGSWKAPAVVASPVRKKEQPTDIDVTESGAYESGTYESSVPDSSPSLTQTLDFGARTNPNVRVGSGAGAGSGAAAGSTQEIEMPDFDDSEHPDETLVQTKPVSTRSHVPTPVESVALDDAAIAELTEDLEAELANMKAVEESARLQKLNLAATAEVEKPGDTVEIESRDMLEVDLPTDEPSEGAEAWRAQTAMLEQAYPADETEAIPFVLDTGNQARITAEEEHGDGVAKRDADSEAESEHEPLDLLDLPEMSLADPASTMEQATMTARSANGDLSDDDGPVGSEDVVKLLEQSSDYESDRVDLQRKVRRHGGR
jgi:TolA-binding protein